MIPSLTISVTSNDRMILYTLTVLHRLQKCSISLPLVCTRQSKHVPSQITRTLLPSSTNYVKHHLHVCYTTLTKQLQNIPNAFTTIYITEYYLSTMLQFVNFVQPVFIKKLLHGWVFFSNFIKHNYQERTKKIAQSRR